LGAGAGAEIVRVDARRRHVDAIFGICRGIITGMFSVTRVLIYFMTLLSSIWNIRMMEKETIAVVTHERAMLLDNTRAFVCYLSSTKFLFQTPV